MDITHKPPLPTPCDNYDIIIVELFYGGSHKTFMDTITEQLHRYVMLTLPHKKWHWHARCGALMIFQDLPQITNEKVLLCSSVLNLAELLGLRPDYNKLKKVVYFHENQLEYPVREIKDRDVQYAYNQITTCIAADVLLFNSDFNRSSFLDNIQKIVKLMPDCKPKNIRSLIEPKCQVLYFPVEFPRRITPCLRDPIPDALHILWPHRWEFDKGPDEFFEVLFQLKEERIPFRLSILGAFCKERPPVLIEAQTRLEEEIMHFGHIPDKREYFRVLRQAHVVVSTAKHEFFGVAMLEATYCGCFPLAPNGLVYPEIYPKECLYTPKKDGKDGLYQALRDFCLDPTLAVEKRANLDIKFEQYRSETIVPQLKQILEL